MRFRSCPCSAIQREELDPWVRHLLRQIIPQPGCVLLPFFQCSIGTGPTLSSVSQGKLIESLTERELEVLVLLAQRRSNKEIAAGLVISPGTVKQHTHNIYQKLNVKGRRQAVREAIELGILNPE